MMLSPSLGLVLSIKTLPKRLPLIRVGIFEERVQISRLAVTHSNHRANEPLSQLVHVVIAEATYCFDCCCAATPYLARLFGEEIGATDFLTGEDGKRGGGRPASLLEKNVRVVGQPKCLRERME